jgi:hypothetical protein
MQKKIAPVATIKTFAHDLGTDEIYLEHHHDDNNTKQIM